MRPSPAMHIFTKSPLRSFATITLSFWIISLVFFTSDEHEKKIYVAGSLAMALPFALLVTLLIFGKKDTNI